MKTFFERSSHFLAAPLGLGPRGLVIIAAFLLLPTYFFPLWKLTMFAPQYPDGLRLSIYSYKLEGGNRGQDIKEINVLNHYIGMRDLVPADFTEFKWIPFVVGMLGLLFLRCALMGNISSLVDIFVLYVYFGLFSLWSFGYKLYTYGHTLSPAAAVRVDPFMPPLFGYRKLANFEVYSYPGIGSYALAATALLLAAAVILAGFEERTVERAEAAVAG